MSLFGQEVSPPVERDRDKSAGEQSESDGSPALGASSSTTDDEFGSKSDKGSSDSYSEEEDARSNRFHGKPSTWRSWNDDEIRTHSSLLQTQDNALSDALIDFHHEISLNAVGDESYSWLSKRVWQLQKLGGTQVHSEFSSWPLPPHMVPDIDEQIGRPRSTSGPDLSLAMRIGDATNTIQQSLMAYGVQCAKKRKRIAMAKTSSLTKANIIPTREAQAPCNSDDRSSGETAAVDERVSIDADDLGTQEGETAVFPLDDDRCQSMLENSSQSIFLVLDKLLLSLHHSRDRHYNNRHSRRSGTDARNPFSKTGEPNDNSDLEPHPHSSTDQKKLKRPYQFRRLRPRDWSEVLGAATLMGWDSEVIQRAAKRCSVLFGEDMSFATSEGDGAFNQHSTSINYASAKIKSRDQLLNSIWKADSLTCPHEGCISHTVQLNTEEELIEHIRKAHAWDLDGGVIPETRLTVGGVHVDGFMCPIPEQTRARK